MNETFTMPMDKLIDRLADLYSTDYLTVAKCCDEVLDRSGTLLGYVRERHYKLKSSRESSCVIYAKKCACQDNNGYYDTEGEA